MEQTLGSIWHSSAGKVWPTAAESALPHSRMDLENDSTRGDATEVVEGEFDLEEVSWCDGEKPNPLSH